MVYDPFVVAHPDFEFWQLVDYLQGADIARYFPKDARVIGVFHLAIVGQRLTLPGQLVCARSAPSHHARHEAAPWVLAAVQAAGHQTCWQ